MLGRGDGEGIGADEAQRILDGGVGAKYWYYTGRHDKLLANFADKVGNANTDYPIACRRCARKTLTQHAHRFEVAKYNYPRDELTSGPSPRHNPTHMMPADDQADQSED